PRGSRKPGYSRVDNAEVRRLGCAVRLSTQTPIEAPQAPTHSFLTVKHTSFAEEPDMNQSIRRLIALLAAASLFGFVFVGGAFAQDDDGGEEEKPEEGD